MPRQRDFNPSILVSYALPCVALPFSRGFKGSGWQLVVFLPRRLILEEEQLEICTAHDERMLWEMLLDHFGGCTIDQALVRGGGLREGVAEVNLHKKFLVLATHSVETRRYFEALRRELEQCSGESQILITRQAIEIL